MSNLFNSVKVTDLPHVWEKAAYSACQCNFVVKICLSIFHFDVWGKLLNLILPVAEVSLLI